MIHDFRYAIRALIRKPGFAALVILTLALGIGANVALFSLVNGVLLRPLPFPQPDQLVTFHQSKQNFATGAVPYPNFLDLQRDNQTFSAMAISRGASFSLVGIGEPERVKGRFISADYFSLLGVSPTLGRTFGAEDERGDGPRVVLISEKFWAHKFYSSRDVLGRTLRLDDGDYSVVGVVPNSLNLSPYSDVYLSLAQWNNSALKNRGAALGLHGVGRLKPGVTIEQAQSDLDRIMQRLAEQYPATNKGNGAKVISLKEQMTGDVRSVLLILFAAVGFVLLIAVVNVSNLLLARAAGRTQEFAIRAALGAGQGRLLRQLIIESTLISMIGGALGLLFAAWTIRLALRALPESLPRTNEVRLDLSVLLFAVAISVLSGLLAGLVPAIKTAIGTVSDTLKEGGRGIRGGRARAQRIFVAVEMALALVLLVGAGLMIRSLQALWTVDPGFRAEGAMTFSVDLPASMSRADGVMTRSVLRDLSQRVNSTPGVNSASLSFGSTPIVNSDDRFFWLEGQKPANQSEMHMAIFYVVEPGYLPTMGLQLKRGRFFTPDDNEHSPAVVVIDEALAQQYFKTEDPIGKHINLDDDEGPKQVVGVVGHIKQWGLEADYKETLQAQLYLPLAGLSDSDLSGTTNVDVIVRGSDLNVTSLLPALRQVVKAQNSLNIVSNTITMDEVIANSLAQRRFSMMVLAVFAGVALCLATIGIYGVVSYLVGQRTHELGIRIALGATKFDVLELVVMNGMKMAMTGVAAGTVAAFLLTRLMAGLLYGVTPTDPLTFSSIALLLSGVALVACYVPARRATKVDPLVSLRYE